MPEMKTLNGYEIVDAKARQDIADLQDKIELVDDSYFLDCSNAPQFANPAPATAVMIEFVEQLMAGKDVCAQIKDSYDDAYYPALININQSSQVFTVYLQKATGGLHLLQENDTWEWDTICLQHDGTECVYFKGGNNSYEFVSKEYVDSAIENATSVDLTGYATEDYVDTAISNIDIPDCTMQVIDITNVTETPTTITDSYTAAILDRIASGEKLSVCLVNKKMVNTYQFPAYITYDSRSINIGMNLETKKVDVGLYLISLKYKFEKLDTQWKVYSQENSTRLIKYGTED